FGTYSNHALNFFANSNFNANLTKLMTLLPSGYVGIGINSPQAKLHVYQDNEAFRLQGSNPYISLYHNDNYNGFFGLDGNNIELGTPNSNTTGNIVIYQQGLPQFTMFSNGRFRAGRLACVLPLTGNTNAPPIFSIMGSIGIKK